MTAIQICALISLVLGAVILYWVGYRGGLIDGRNTGIEEGKAIQHADSLEAIRNADLLLEQARKHRQSLYEQYALALDATKLGAGDRQTLLAIAEKLRLAADTFRAVSSKDQSVQTLALRDEALKLAALLEPVAQEKVA